METHVLPYRNSRISYHRFGQGTRFLFCFHGYGEEGRSFLFLEKWLGSEYTIIAPDLPFHGETEWNEPGELQPAELKEIMQAIVPLDLQQVALAGYSMGGRIALAILQEMPASISRVVLVAPDGLHRNFWYWLATQTGAGNRLFNYTMRNPHWFFNGMKFLRGLGLLNKSIFKFAHSYLDDDKERDLLYKRWTVMRRFRPRLPGLKQVLQQHGVPIRMLFGSYDRIIVSKQSTGIAAADQVKIKVIRAGHQLLKAKHGRDIAALFVE